MLNYDDVLGQLRGDGLCVDRLEIGRVVRCRVDGGGREKRGWYCLHELRMPSGDLLIVGSYGVWQGNENNARKIDLRKSEISDDQRAALRTRLAEDRKRADAMRAAEARQAAARAEHIWAKLQHTGESDYLTRKGIGAHGVRFTPSGSAVIPLLDVAGRIHGLQFLRTAAGAKAGRRPEKEFWPAGIAKKGHFHLIGSPQHVLLIAEGYATAASLYAATGYPVAVAFDAGNLLPVAEALHARYKRARILICADDDSLGKCRDDACRARVVLPLHPVNCPACGNPHRATNAGVDGASAAALAVGGAWVAPTFSDPEARYSAWLEKGCKDTDFNDLHAADGLHVVRAQIEARLSELGWDRVRAAAPITPTQGSEGDGKLRPIQSVEELLSRFALVYGQSGTVFDHAEHALLSLSDMRDACIRRELHRAWMEHPDRDLVRVREVGFDPAGEDPEITCNLWAGWPTLPKAGRCEKLLELLRYLCSGEQQSERLFEWVLRWIAYPIQHPGAKMRTCLVLHGPQGAGKNLFFEAVMAIYGAYGRVIGQDAVEDRFNDWASRKLFLIADEVVARSDLFHVKNKLKALITGDWIRINPKNIAAYDERNHVNLVFLSNEQMPVVLEEHDRRHCVIWTPKELDQSFYRAAIAEIADGGIAALHQHLLDLDLGDHHAGSRPPATAAKNELINLALDSPARFWDDVYLGDLRGLKPMPGLTTDWYDAYKVWCARCGQRAAPMPKFINALDRKRDTQCVRKRYLLGSSIYGPHGVLMMGNPEPPLEVTEQEWLGGFIAQLKQRLGDYKGQA